MRCTTLMSSLIIALVVGVTTPSSYADTITEIVAGSGGEFDDNQHDYDILLTAVLAAGLEDALGDPHANLTVFAPNDRAFIKLARDLGYEGNDEGDAWLFLVDVLTELGGEAGPIPVLTDILLYHVAPERISPIDLIIRTIFRDDIVTLLPDATIRPRFLKLKDNDRDFRDPRVRFPFNIQADNGVIHTINRVLIPVDLP